MARLVGFIGNRPDLGARVVELESAALRVRVKPGTPMPGWGVGFYQGGEILLKRRPVDDRRELNFTDITRGLRTDTLIAQVRVGTTGASRTEDTHPFRYRQWLFANTGTIESFATLRSRLNDSLPQFLQRDVRGDTDSELLFHLFLSFLHDTGLLDRPTVDPATARSALRSCISLVDRLCAEEGAGPTTLNVLVASPDYLLAMRGGGQMAYRVYQGQSDLEKILGDGGLGRMRLPDFASSRLVLIAADFDDDQVPAGWTAVDGRAMVTITRTDEPLVEPF
jgi:glutamine amidotransferase